MKRIKTKKLNYKLIFILSFIISFIIILNKKNNLLSLLFDETLRKNNLLNINTLLESKNLIYMSLNKVVEKDDLTLIKDLTDFDYNTSKSNYIKDPNPTNNEITKPIVYIYNTHQTEEYELNNIYDYSVKPNVMISSYILREELNKKNIPTIVETSNIKEYLNNNNYKYNMSYHASEYFSRIAFKNNPSLKYFIDIHRDSISYEKSTYSYNGISYAKILFIDGMSHTIEENNLYFADTLNNILNEMYPGISRGVSYRNSTPKYGTYYTDIDAKGVLIEIGSNYNTIEEVNNTTKLLASVIERYINTYDKEKEI